MNKLIPHKLFEVIDYFTKRRYSEIVSSEYPINYSIRKLFFALKSLKFRSIFHCVRSNMLSVIKTINNIGLLIVIQQKNICIIFSASSNHCFECNIFTEMKILK